MRFMPHVMTSVFLCMCLYSVSEGRGDFQPQLNSAMQDVSDKYILLEETEKQALRKALIEERQRFCCFVALLQPVVTKLNNHNDDNLPI
ncbi:Metastasis suppressor protein 1 [Xenoophorus captivus]|uniref:Metastasis suppressor protein 1 n=1 Tax=Xenoophorus captivus TaxID=1517983 RepID=A0ABV0QJB3_9TELE